MTPEAVDRSHEEEANDLWKRHVTEAEERLDEETFNHILLILDDMIQHHTIPCFQIPFL